MKKIFFMVVLIASMLATYAKTSAQSEPVLYFCEHYDDNMGEVGISDRYTTGYITVVVKCANSLNLTDCTIQYSKWNGKKFAFYKDHQWVIKSTQKYVYFSRDDMGFDTPGFYRVYLLDPKRNTIASALLEVISK